MQSVISADTQPESPVLDRSLEMDEFEGYIRPHGARIAALSDALAAQFNLAVHDRFFLKQAAYLHDVGEVAMNRDYISSGRILSREEYTDMQRHPVIGEQEVSKMGLPRSVQLLIRWHHEWWNGSGYPDGLLGEQIPFAARILRVADTFAALTDSRPFRAAISADEARKYVAEWSGIEFDPKVVKGILALDELPELGFYSVSIE